MLALDSLLDNLKLWSTEFLIVIIKVLVVFVVGLVGAAPLRRQPGTL